MERVHEVWFPRHLKDLLDDGLAFQPLLKCWIAILGQGQLLSPLNNALDHAKLDGTLPSNVLLLLLLQLLQHRELALKQSSLSFSLFVISRGVEPPLEPPGHPRRRAYLPLEQKHQRGPLAPYPAFQHRGPAQRRRMPSSIRHLGCTIVHLVEIQEPEYLAQLLPRAPNCLQLPLIVALDLVPHCLLDLLTPRNLLALQPGGGDEPDVEVPLQESILNVPVLRVQALGVRLEQGVAEGQAVDDVVEAHEDGEECQRKDAPLAWGCAGAAASVAVGHSRLLILYLL